MSFEKFPSESESEIEIKKKSGIKSRRRKSRQLLQESEPENKRESGIIRFVGVESAEERELLLRVKEIFENEQELVANELPKTPEQQEIIKFLANEIPKFAAKYGAEPLNLTENKVVLHEQSLLSKIKSFIAPIEVGRYQSHKQRVDLILIERLKKSHLFFAHMLAHEFLHFQAFQSYTVVKENPNRPILIERRGGLKIGGHKSGRDFVYFNKLDEAVIEELTRRFDENILSQTTIPTLHKEIEERRKSKELLAARGQLEKANELVAAQSESQLVFLEIERSAKVYTEERKKLNNLIREIYEKNKNEFGSEEDVFDVFAKAVMSGRLLPLARLIEKTFGKGSFRQLGEETGGEVSQKT